MSRRGALPPQLYEAPRGSVLLATCAAGLVDELCATVVPRLVAGLHLRILKAAATKRR